MLSIHSLALSALSLLWPHRRTDTQIQCQVNFFILETVLLVVFKLPVAVNLKHWMCLELKAHKHKLHEVTILWTKEKGHLEKLTVPPLVKIFSSFYWTQRFLAGEGRSNSRRTERSKFDCSKQSKYIWMFKIIEIHTAVDSVPASITTLLCFRFESPNATYFYLNLRVILCSLKSTVKYLNCSSTHCVKKKKLKPRRHFLIVFASGSNLWSW